MGQEVTWYTKVQMVVHVPVEDSATTTAPDMELGKWTYPIFH